MPYMRREQPGRRTYIRKYILNNRKFAPDRFINLRRFYGDVDLIHDRLQINYRAIKQARATCLQSSFISTHAATLPSREH
jgi:hypothetical protein